jgi:hypothetical protein
MTSLPLGSHGSVDVTNPLGSRALGTGGVVAFSGVRDQMRSELHYAPFHMWIEPLQEAGIQNDRLVLVGSPRVIAWVARRYGRRLGTLARERMGLRGVILKGVAW